MAAARVLVVDDNPVNVELATLLLEDAGFVVDTAPGAEQACRHIAEHRPDLILMDIQLPGTDGLTFTRALKANPATQGIVIAAFTAFAMKGDEAAMRAAGCDGYLSKPLDVATFADTIQALLRRGSPAV